MLMNPGSATFFFFFFCKPPDDLCNIQTIRRLLNYHVRTREEERKCLALGKITIKAVLQGAQKCMEVDSFSRLAETVVC